MILLFFTLNLLGVNVKFNYHVESHDFFESVSIAWNSIPINLRSRYLETVSNSQI